MKKIYLRFSLMTQIPGTQPFSVESEPPRWWPGEPSVFQVPSIILPSGKFGKHCLQAVGTENSHSALGMIKSNTSLSTLDVLSARTLRTETEPLWACLVKQASLGLKERSILPTMEHITLGLVVKKCKWFHK